jgi:hypothetical protein
MPTIFKGLKELKGLVRVNEQTNFTSPAKITTADQTDSTPPAEIATAAPNNVIIDVSKPMTCTPIQLQAIEKQLPTDKYCFGTNPWENKCPITDITSCPRPIWIWNYYANNDRSSTDSTFLAIDVGCNSGYHGIQTLRMGAYDESISVATWDSALESISQGGSARCNWQKPDSQIEIKAGSKARGGKLFCIEPLGVNFDALTKANDITKYNSKGFEIFRYEVSNQIGTTFSPIADRGDGRPWQKVVVGQTQMYLGGYGACSSLAEWCTSVELVTLDSFVEKNVPKEGTINVLLSESSVDYEVLTGGSNMLQRTEYIEFGLSWKGTWANHNLIEVIDFLDKLEFTCYWAGKSKLWRITGCLREVYDRSKFIATIACVNRKLVESKTLAMDMERIFLETIG